MKNTIQAEIAMKTSKLFFEEMQKHDPTNEDVVSTAEALFLGIMHRISISMNMKDEFPMMMANHLIQLVPKLKEIPEELM